MSSSLITSASLTLDHSQLTTHHKHNLTALKYYNYKLILRELLNAREKERRQEVTPPVACTRRTRSEVSDDDEGDDDDDANSVGAGAAA